MNLEKFPAIQSGKLNHGTRSVNRVRATSKVLVNLHYTVSHLFGKLPHQSWNLRKGSSSKTVYLDILPQAWAAAIVGPVVPSIVGDWDNVSKYLLMPRL